MRKSARQGFITQFRRQASKEIEFEIPIQHSFNITYCQTYIVKVQETKNEKHILHKMHLFDPYHYLFWPLSQVMIMFASSILSNKCTFKEHFHFNKIDNHHYFFGPASQVVIASYPNLAIKTPFTSFHDHSKKSFAQTYSSIPCPPLIPMLEIL